MRLALLRTLATAIIGASAGATCVAILFAARPGLILDMDRDLGDAASGFYLAERAGDETFVWTSAIGTLTLRDFDRAGPWNCVVRLRGPRPPASTQPIVEIGADGVALASRAASGGYEDFDVTIPARPAADGLTLTILTAPTFVPGPSDRRALGVQVDRLACRPADDRFIWAPRAALAAGAIAAGLFGAATGVLIGASGWVLIGLTVLAVVQAFPLGSGLGPYTGFPNTAMWLAVGIVVPMLLAVFAAIRWNAQPLHPAARFVLLFSAATLFLKLIALLHPAKLVIDAVFHAHRLEWVLDGRYFFTQPMREGVQFPYAIGLYVFAAPWAALTSDHVALLRIVVCVAQACAGVLLYTMAARRWNDRAVAAIAVVLFHLVPLPYVILGNANLTYAFGQSVGLVAIAAATIWTLGSKDVLQWTGVLALASLAFLSHVGTFPLTLSTLLAIALLYRVLDRARLKVPARVIAAATLLAVAFAVFAYYGRFSEVYATLDRVRAQAASATGIAGTKDPPAAQPDGTARATSTPRTQRFQAAGRLALDAYGWPLLLLAFLGGWQLFARGVGDRLSFAIIAWMLTCAAFVLFSVLAPVGRGFERYADEFILRVYDATAPAVVLLAAGGALWAWRSHLALRLAATGLVGAAALRGFQQWTGWLS